MQREEALRLLAEHLKNRNLLKHSLAVEACMGGLARHFGADEACWRLAGLLHDLDYEYTVDSPHEHTLKTTALLEPFGLPAEIPHAIRCHNQMAVPASAMDHALTAVDPTSGFVIACALMHPQKKLSLIDLPFMTKRFKEKSFARGASREQMLTCSRLGLELDAFLALCLAAMQEIAAELGL